MSVPDWSPKPTGAYTLDARDATPEPPAELDPRWVLTMRRRVLSLSWPALKASRENQEQGPRWME